MFGRKQPLLEVRDVKEYIKRIKKEGEPLTPQEFVNVFYELDLKQLDLFRVEQESGKWGRLSRRTNTKWLVHPKYVNKEGSHHLEIIHEKIPVDTISTIKKINDTHITVACFRKDSNNYYVGEVYHFFKGTNAKPKEEIVKF